MNSKLNYSHIKGDLLNFKKEFANLLGIISHTLLNLSKELQRLIALAQSYSEYYYRDSDVDSSFMRDVILPSQKNVLLTFNDIMNLADENRSYFSSLLNKVKEITDLHNSAHSILHRNSSIRIQKDDPLDHKISGFLSENEQSLSMYNEIYRELQVLRKKNDQSFKNEISGLKIKFENFFLSISDSVINISNDVHSMQHTFYDSSRILQSLIYDAQIEDIESQNIDKVIFSIDFFTNKNHLTNLTREKRKIDLNKLEALQSHLITSKCATIAEDLDVYLHRLNEWNLTFQEALKHNISLFDKDWFGVHSNKVIELSSYSSEDSNTLKNLFDKLIESIRSIIRKQNELLFRLIKNQQRSTEVFSLLHYILHMDDAETRLGINEEQRNRVVDLQNRYDHTAHDVAEIISKCQNTILDMERIAEKSNFSINRISGVVDQAMKFNNDSLEKLLERLKFINSNSESEWKAFGLLDKLIYNMGLIVKNTDVEDPESSKEYIKSDLFPIVDSIRTYLVTEHPSNEYRQLLFVSFLSEFLPQVNKNIIFFDQE